MMVHNIQKGMYEIKIFKISKKTEKISNMTEGIICIRSNNLIMPYIMYVKFHIFFVGAIAISF